MFDIVDRSMEGKHPLLHTNIQSFRDCASTVRGFLMIWARGDVYWSGFCVFFVGTLGFLIRCIFGSGFSRFGWCASEVGGCRSRRCSLAGTLCFLAQTRVSAHCRASVRFLSQISRLMFARDLSGGVGRLPFRSARRSHSTRYSSDSPTASPACSSTFRFIRTTMHKNAGPHPSPLAPSRLSASR